MFIDNIITAALTVLELKNLGLMTIGVLAGLLAGAIPGFTITRRWC